MVEDIIMVEDTIGATVAQEFMDTGVVATEDIEDIIIVAYLESTIAPITGDIMDLIITTMIVMVILRAVSTCNSGSKGRCFLLGNTASPYHLKVMNRMVGTAT
jgi:hypothetical protein